MTVSSIAALCNTRHETHILLDCLAFRWSYALSVTYI